MAEWKSFWDIPGMKAGVIVGDVAWNLLKHAKAHGYAIPAFNCTTSSSVNSVLEAGHKLGRPVMIQFSEGGSCFFAGKSLSNKDKEASVLGAVAGAHLVRCLAPAYGIPVLVHSDHCAKKLLPWFDGMLVADQEHFKANGEPLFSSHMLDLSEEPHDVNIGLCVDYFKKMAPLNLILEMEIGITGGVEDGVDNSGVSKDKLYSTPDDVWQVWEALSPISEKFTIAAAFGNVHGVYKPGNVKLQPNLLDDFQKFAGGKTGTDKPFFFVFHGGSGSEKADIDNAVSYGVVKMNVDTDTQWAYWEGLLHFYKNNAAYLQGQIGNSEGADKPNKSYYDPRKWVRESELTMVDRIQESCLDLHNTAGGYQMSALGKAMKKIIKHPKVAGVDAPAAALASASDIDAVKSLCLSFVKTLAGDADSAAYLKTGEGTKFAELAAFFDHAVGHISTELSHAPSSTIIALDSAGAGDPSGVIKKSDPFWKAFFPNAMGVVSQLEQKTKELKEKRKVTITELNPNPIADPIHEILFTSNVLLGLPAENKDISTLPYTADFKAKLEATKAEKQVAWFDHPIQIGVEPDGNEILYGLIGLDQAVGWEKEKGNIGADDVMLTALSITCTHAGLQSIAKQYVDEEFAAMPADKKLKHLKILLFSEIETDAIVDNVLKPALAKIGKEGEIEHVREIFGVEGQYGRHYSFLKAVLPVYNAFIDEKVRATFKIDIDQLFIQESLMAETGESMLTHYKTPTWGAKGKNWRGEDIELGMIAGALCNQKDWEANDKKLFVADVKPPAASKKLSAEELVFFSGLPQAYSTEAEMMTKYDDPSKEVIQRIHVTGGTNGILVDYLFKFRPFCPSYIGRAEDQSYLFSTFGKAGAKLGYVHKPGLIMRHDKEAFAADAMEAARIGKMVGDYERILLFSEYAKFCCQPNSDFNSVMDLVNPFTGCFVSAIPKTVMYIRFALKALGWVADGADKDAIDFTICGAPRVTECIAFTDASPGKPSKMEVQWKKEQAAWDVFYDALLASKGNADISAAAKVIFDKATATL